MEKLKLWKEFKARDVDAYQRQLRNADACRRKQYWILVYAKDNVQLGHEMFETKELSRYSNVPEAIV